MPKVAPNHKCVICEKLYYYCDTCGKLKHITPWKTCACSAECYAVYMTYAKYRTGEINDETMTEVLKQNGFKGKKVAPVLQTLFDRLLADPEPELEHQVIEEEIEETPVRIEETENQTSKKRKYHWFKSSK